MARCPLSLLQGRRGEEICSPSSIDTSEFRIRCLVVGGIAHAWTLLNRGPARTFPVVSESLLDDVLPLHALWWSVGGSACSGRASCACSDEANPICARTATFVPACVSELLLPPFLFILICTTFLELWKISARRWRWMPGLTVGTWVRVVGEMVNKNDVRRIAYE